MKKRVLKIWIENIIIIIQCLLIMLLAGDCESNYLFFISKAIILIIFLINHLILCKYTDLFSEVKYDHN